MQQVTSKQSPLVSVVTPVYNGASYLRECIESVLAQSYSSWDYTIVNNCSTDGTLDIAREYAARDSRIRVHNNEAFCRLNANYNNAFRLISPESKYCKVVAADDWLFPECIEQMVRLAEEHPTVGLVGAYGYGFHSTRVVWDGLPYPSTVVPGRILCREILMGGPYIFGTPTAVLFRADVVRSRKAFFNEDNIHADTEACMDVMEHYDLGFVHQVLTYSRVREDSMTSLSQRVNTYLAHQLYTVLKFGPKYLSERELEIWKKRRLGNYYRFLGEEAFRSRGREFWDFHRGKLQALGYPLSTRRLLGAIGARAATSIVSPGWLVISLARRMSRRLGMSPE